MSLKFVSFITFEKQKLSKSFMKNTRKYCFVEEISISQLRILSSWNFSLIWKYFHVLKLKQLYYPNIHKMKKSFECLINETNQGVHKIMVVLWVLISSHPPWLWQKSQRDSRCRLYLTETCKINAKCHFHLNN